MQWGWYVASKRRCSATGACYQQKGEAWESCLTFSMTFQGLSDQNHAAFQVAAIGAGGQNIVIHGIRKPPPVLLSFCSSSRRFHGFSSKNSWILSHFWLRNDCSRCFWQRSASFPAWMISLVVYPSHSNMSARSHKDNFKSSLNRLGTWCVE